VRVGGSKPRHGGRAVCCAPWIRACRRRLNGSQAFRQGQVINAARMAIGICNNSPYVPAQALQMIQHSQVVWPC